MLSAVEIREVRLEDTKCLQSGTLEFAGCGSLLKRREICSQCFKFLLGFELSVVDLRSRVQKFPA